MKVGSSFAAPHARLIADSTASPATLHAIAQSAGSAARIELSSSTTAEVATAPVARQPRPSWTPHLTRVFPASIARTTLTVYLPARPSTTLRSEISADDVLTARPSAVATTSVPSGATSEIVASNGGSRAGTTRTARP